MDMSEREPYAVPEDAPVVVHRHGERSRLRSIAVIVDSGDYRTEREFELALSWWRRRIGGWVTKAEAADRLGVSTKRVDQLRKEGRLVSKRIGGVAAIDAASLDAELRLREESAEQ